MSIQCNVIQVLKTVKQLIMYCFRKISKMHCSIKEAIYKCVCLYILPFVLNTQTLTVQTHIYLYILPFVFNMYKRTNRYLLVLCLESLLKDTQEADNTVCLLGRDLGGWRIELQEIDLLFSMLVLLLQTVS